MKIISATEEQIKLLNFLDTRLSTYIALISMEEYYFWLRRFTHLQDALSAFIYPASMAAAVRLPIVQCVAKFMGTNSDGFLLPKVFKFGTFTDDTIKDFGMTKRLLPLLDTLYSTIPYTTSNFLLKEYKYNYLGLFMGSIKKKDLALPLFMPCTSRISEIELTDKITFKGREYTHILHNNSIASNLLQELHSAKMLVLPLNCHLGLESLIGFADPIWASVHNLEYFLEEDPKKLNNYVLIRVDDRKVLTWSDIIANPRLRLELEMSQYWVWQEECRAAQGLENINLYWEFGMDYPYLIDKRDESIIPVFLVDN